MKAVPALARVAAALLAAAVLRPAPLDAQKTPPVGDVLGAAVEYLAAYGPRISGVTLEEEYTLLEVSGGRVGLTRKIASDVVLLDVNGVILSLRDPYSVDSNALRDRTPRITAALARPSEATWARARGFASEAARYFQDELILRLNDPMLALRFLAPENQPRLSYKIDGRKKIGDVETAVLKFQETKTKPPAYILETPGGASTSGKIWIDPASGRIHRTELSIQSDSEYAHIIVEYGRDAALDAWLPVSMADTYEGTERVGTGMNNLGAGSPGVARRGFDCRAAYSNVRHTPIDLRAR